MSNSNHSFNLQTVLSEDFIRTMVFPEIEKELHSFASKKEIPQITRKIESFIPPKCIKTGPINIGMNDNNKSLIFLEKFLLVI